MTDLEADEQEGHAEEHDEVRESRLLEILRLAVSADGRGLVPRTVSLADERNTGAFRK